MLKSALTMVLPVTATGHLPTTGTQTACREPVIQSPLVVGNTVTYDVGDNFLEAATLNLDGELTRASVLRIGGSTFNVGSTGVISGGFMDLNFATLNFQDGAQFTGTSWEHKGTNVFDFRAQQHGLHGPDTRHPDVMAAACPY